MLVVEIDGVLERICNMGMHLCFLSVEFQCSPDVCGTINVRVRKKQRLKKWTERKCQMLISSVELCVEIFISRKRGVAASSKRDKIFSNLVCRDKTCASTYFMRNYENGGALMPEDFDVKSG